MRKKGPIILLSLLLLILIFVVGVRYGQKVEQTNKVIKAIISIPPSPTPTKPKPVVYKTYQSKPCNLEFLYPDSLVLKESSTEAVFAENKTVAIEIGCEKTPKFFEVYNDTKVASAEVTFKNQKVLAKIPSKDMYLFRVNSTIDGRNIFVLVNKTLYPLFEKTLIYKSF